MNDTTDSIIVISSVGITCIALILAAQGLIWRIQDRRRRAFDQHATEAIAVVDGTPLTEHEWAVIEDLEANFRAEPYRRPQPKEGAE